MQQRIYQIKVLPLPCAMITLSKVQSFGTPSNTPLPLASAEDPLQKEDSVLWQSCRACSEKGSHLRGHLQLPTGFI